MADRHKRTQNFSENAKKEHKISAEHHKAHKISLKFIWIFFLETPDQWIVSSLFIPTLARRHWQWGQEFCKAILGAVDIFMYIYPTITSLAV